MSYISILCCATNFNVRVQSDAFYFLIFFFFAISTTSRPIVSHLLAIKTVGSIFRRVRTISESDYWLRRVCPSAWNDLAPTGLFSWNFVFGLCFSKICRENSSFFKSLTRIMGTLREDQYTFLVISLAVLLRTRNDSDKHSEENENRYFIFSKFFLRKSCRL